MNKKTNIYVFDFGNQVKIGQSGNVKSRLRTIETQSGREAVHTFSIEAEPAYENLAHKLLSEYRGIGEYFEVPFEFAVSILKSLIRFSFVKEIKPDSQIFLPLENEKPLKTDATNVLINREINVMTVTEMADKLKLPRDTVMRRILRGGYKPLTKDAVYAPEVFEAIKDSPGKGRPRKAATPEPVKSRAKK